MPRPIRFRGLKSKLESIRTHFLSHTLNVCSFVPHFTNTTDYRQQRRNQVYGPNHTGADMGMLNGFKVPGMEQGKLKLGVQFVNLFNHPSFQIPDSDVNDSTLGVIYSTANTPTSILGASLGGSASTRLIQLKGTFTF
jgi:hypothetical protein